VDLVLYSNPAGYEGYMGRWSLALAPSFLRFACLREPRSLLDLGCGTGSLMRAAAQCFPRARLVGMDPVLGYLTHARATVGRVRAGFVAGLVEQVPFADGAFDYCLSLLLLQEIRDRGLALSEMHRVTREGGIVAACQWDFRRGMPMSVAIREVLNVVVPDVCKSLGKRRAAAFGSEAELRQHWEAAGLADVATARLVAGLSYASFDDLWQPLLSGSTPVSAAVAALRPEAREEVHRRLRERLLCKSRDGSFSLEAEAFAVRGRVVRGADRGTCSEGGAAGGTS
jgi:ubiquinone/menaquinone biosynthesis C-methylase UbiE